MMLWSSSLNVIERLDLKMMRDSFCTEINNRRGKNRLVHGRKI